MWKNEYLVAIVAVHTAENEPSKVCLYLSLFCLYLVLRKWTWQILMMQHSPRSTRLSKWISDFCNFSKTLKFDEVWTVFCFKDDIKFHFILVKLQGSKMSSFRPSIDEILSEFRGMIKNLASLTRVTGKVQYFL